VAGNPAIKSQMGTIRLPAGCAVESTWCETVGIGSPCLAQSMACCPNCGNCSGTAGVVLTATLGTGTGPYLIPVTAKFNRRPFFGQFFYPCNCQSVAEADSGLSGAGIIANWQGGCSWGGTLQGVSVPWTGPHVLSDGVDTYDYVSDIPDINVHATVAIWRDAIANAWYAWLTTGSCAVAREGHPGSCPWAFPPPPDDPVVVFDPILDADWVCCGPNVFVNPAGSGGASPDPGLTLTVTST
jgi:hypothetical protein